MNQRRAINGDFVAMYLYIKLLTCIQLTQKKLIKSRAQIQQRNSLFSLNLMHQNDEFFNWFQLRFLFPIKKKREKKLKVKLNWVDEKNTLEINDATNDSKIVKLKQLLHLFFK